jgi:catechol 2,3-dioxygenase-like lactoylglutathione lyase family enzyme
MKSHFILYVADQEASGRFWSHVLDRPPSLEVPGMTEFELAEGAVLGLMPASGIKRLLGDRLPEPIVDRDAAKAEIYLLVENAADYHARAIASGARELSAFQLRDWGDVVAYSLDPDGHVLAFAQRGETG